MKKYLFAVLCISLFPLAGMAKEELSHPIEHFGSHLVCQKMVGDKTMKLDVYIDPYMSKTMKAKGEYGTTITVSSVNNRGEEKTLYYSMNVLDGDYFESALPDNYFPKIEFYRASLEGDAVVAPWKQEKKLVLAKQDSYNVIIGGYLPSTRQAELYGFSKKPIVFNVSVDCARN